MKPSDMPRQPPPPGRGPTIPLAAVAQGTCDAGKLKCVRNKFRCLGDVYLQDRPSGLGCCPTGSVPEAKCLPAGSGLQGSTCSHHTHCRAGFVCAVTGNGDTCLDICEVGTPKACANGLLCTALTGSNMPDLGVCL
jgi:hypothetical protein